MYMDEEDSSYIPVCSYFGAYEANAGESGICFADQYTPTDPDAPYQEGETVTWTDITVVRGRQYQYKVQSYTDIESRVITSDKSIATSEPGWAVAPLSFEMDPVIYDDEYDSEGNPVSHKTANLSATLTFDTLGKADSYTYELTVNYQALQTADASINTTVLSDGKVYNFDTIDDVDAFVYTVDLTNEAELKNKEGVYTFTVKVKYKAGTWEESVSTINSRYVVKALQPLVVQNLVVEDGYPDKFVLKWDRDPTITYEIQYRSKDSTSPDDYTTAKTVEPDPDSVAGTIERYTYEFTHYDGDRKTTPVKSGDVQYIRIRPSVNGSASSAIPSDDNIYYTLGTPAVEFNESNAAADSITVTWPKIEKATSYEVTYAYDGVPVETQVLRDGVATTFADAYKADTQIIPVTKEEEIQVTDDITYVISMAYSGKDVTVTVKAINETRKTETTKTATTRTLGPAAAGVKATVATKEDSIHVSWKEVPGATGYLIARTRYGANNTDDSRSSDGEFVYFYNGSELSVVGQEEAQIDSTVTLQDDTFTLADTYTDSTGVAMNDPTRKFRIEQDKLGWGYPYRYQVFPVTVTANPTSPFERSGNLNLCTVTTRTTLIDDTGKVTYQDGEISYQDADKNYVVGSAIGYGLDVKATKAESADTVTVTWTKPYLEDNTTLKPVLLRVETGSSETDWITYSQADFETGLNKATVHLSSDMANRNNAYDYVIKYVPSGSSGFNYTPLPAYIEAQKGDKTLNEPANKGYFFSIMGAEATKTDIKDGGVSTFAEELAITPYNWTERKNGPEAYKIYIKNNNIGKNADGKVWHLVATVPVKKDSYGTPAVNVSDINVTVSGSGLRFTPVFSGDVHGGLLKVLRDYKHYYKIEAVRTIKDSDGVETEITAVLGDDDSIWGARQITAKEFAFVATLSVGESLYNDNFCSSGAESGYVWVFDFNKSTGPYFLSISGLMHGSRAGWLTGRPYVYGANYKPVETYPEKAVLNLNSLDTSVSIDYSGTVEIENFSKDGGTFVVKYKSETLDFTAEARNYVPFR